MWVQNYENLLFRLFCIFCRMDRYISGAEVKKVFSVSSCALRKWADEGRVKAIRMVGGKRLYSADDISSIFGQARPTRSKVCYARVSSSKQRDDLHRQVGDLRRLYPGHSIVTDVGSALNFKRPGFLSLLDRVSSNAVEEIVVLHKDRLCRFGFELVEWICSKHNTSLVVHDKSGVDCDQRELADDLLAITNYFVAKNNGRRAARNRRARKIAEPDQSIQNQTQMAPLIG